jgi:putative phosphoesterase
MRLAALSDVHGNLDALQAVLADLRSQSPDLVVNLGDCLSGPLWPAETCDLLMDQGWQTVRGNHDRWLTAPPDPIGPWEADSLPLLSPEHLIWLAALPVTAVVEDIFLCHATPQDDLTYWMEDAASDGEVHRAALSTITERAFGIQQRLMLCGHSHVARAVRLLDGRLVVNPGSVGGPGFTDDGPPHRVASGTPFAAYAVLDSAASGWSVAHRLIPYDTTRAVARAAQNAEWAEALASGWIGEKTRIRL